MKLPDKIKVSGFTIAIEEWESSEAAAQGKYGMFSPHQLKIQVDTSIDPQIVAETLLHEVLHAIFWANIIDTTLDEEPVVEKTSLGLFQVLRDNPNLIKFFTNFFKRN